MLLTGCGYTQVDGELIGQVKKVNHRTPLICPDYVGVDVSLGVMKNGVGSMSTQDVYLVVASTEQEKVFRAASESGKIVKVHYSVKRFGGNYVVCTPDHFSTGVEYAK